MSNTPITDRESVGHIGFYSCATVPASTCRAIEASRNELLEALETLFNMRKGCGMPVTGAWEIARVAISKAKGN